MSKPMPMRMWAMESDSEDDFKTPAKRVTKMLPKKSSELMPLESESDDEEDNLNCAILNDSFLLTPSKVLDTPAKTDPAPPQELPPPVVIDIVQKTSILSLIKKENDQNAPNLQGKDRVLSTIKGSEELRVQPKRLDMDSEMKKPELNVLSYRPINRDQAINNPPLAKKKIDLTSGDSGVNLNTSWSSASPIQFFTNSEARSKSDEVNQRNPVQEKEEKVFATPALHKMSAPSSVRLGRTKSLMSVTNTKTNQSVLETDFHKRKVLFTTPIGLSCKPVSSIANSSISLNLDDSILGRIPDTPNVDPLKKREHLATVQEAETTLDKKNIRRIKNSDYYMEKKIGHGGSSMVYLARRLDTGLEVALKVVDLQGDDNIVEGYLNETKLLVSLQGNPNIITLYDYYHSVDESLLYLVMEKGETDLHKILQSYKKDVPLFTLMRYWYEMLLAVDFIHQRGVIHSDLKPANFLMVKGRLKLIDFGIATKMSLDATSIVKHTQAGTFNYISPEAVTDTSGDGTSSPPKIKISTKSDVWSLGCILYLLIYKHTPFSHITNPMYKITAIANPNTEIKYPELPIYYPPFLLKMIRACLKHNPKERASVQDLLKFPFDMIIPID